jgi:hypothetical protein
VIEHESFVDSKAVPICLDVSIEDDDVVESDMDDEFIQYPMIETTTRKMMMEKKPWGHLHDAKAVYHSAEFFGLGDAESAPTHLENLFTMRTLGCRLYYCHDASKRRRVGDS